MAAKGAIALAPRGAKPLACKASQQALQGLYEARPKLP
jgi:hypothetical protein